MHYYKTILLNKTIQKAILGRIAKRAFRLSYSTSKIKDNGWLA